MALQSLGCVSLSRYLQPAASYTGGMFSRGFVQPAVQSPEKAGQVEVVPVRGSAGLTAFVRPAQRPWGALAKLPETVMAALSGKQQPNTVVIVRDAFAPFDAQATSLHKVMKSLGADRVAIVTSAANTEKRLVVDEYAHDGSGRYDLSSVGTDLLTYASEAGLQVALVPELQGSHNSVTAVQKGIRQSTNEVLMVAPTAFGFNEQAAQDNSFMHKAATPGAGSSLTRKVLKEFAELHHQLTEVAGVQVHLFQHDLAHGTPDACFPNNWFSTHPAGEAEGGVKQSTLVLYPMKCPNRAMERRADIVDVLHQRGMPRVVDLTPHEKEGQFFEGTGVLVLDRVNGVAYVDISERASAELAQRWVSELGYRELVAFHSFDARGKSVYHTNVMMAIGTDVAVVCAESVKDEKERKHLLSRLRRHHEVVEISLSQMDELCGNVLELQDGRGLPVLAMSTRSHRAFTPEQHAVLRRHVADLVHADISTLEEVGGGGVRCTLAELF